ncbi:MAG: hypothetical protein J6035_06035 [Bacteroidaceae bacterium]|nr:hypothetical protein [Bacteroidaceae bacterium]
MKTFKYILGAVCISVASSAMAQNLNSAYFMDGYTYGYELNPAKDYERKGFVSMPILSNINMSLSGNLDYTDIFYKLPNGKLATFMHPKISADEALKNFSSREKLAVDMRLDIINFGFHAWNGYNFFNLSMRSTTGFSAPYELFEMAKTLANKNYDIGKVCTQSTTWMEIGFGHSHQVTDAWRVGGTMKILLGGARMNMKANNLKMELAGPDKWILTSDAEMEVAAKGFTWGEDKYGNPIYNTDPYDNGEPREPGIIKLNKMDITKGGIGGVGLAFDFGAEWDLEKNDLVKGLKVSASLLDFGFINWSDIHKAKSVENSYEFDGFNNIKVKDGDGRTLGSQFDDFTTGVSKLYNFQDKGTESGARMLGATLNIGVNYKMPFYNKLDVGFLNTTRIQGAYSWNDTRLSANIHPVKWLEGGINLGFGTLGASFGWIINIHTRGFSLFAGMDRIMSKLSKQYIPTKSSTNVSLGISFPFGSRQ